MAPRIRISPAAAAPVGLALLLAALAGLVLLLAALAAGRASPEGAAPAALHLPAEAARSVVVMISGAEGWTPGLEARAARLARGRALVVGLDLRRLPRDCAEAGRAATALVRAATARAGVGAIPPTLVGREEGAGLALAMAAAAPDAVKGLATDRLAPAPGCPEAAEAATAGRLAKAPVRWFDLTDAAGRSPLPPLPGVAAVAPDGERIRPRRGTPDAGPAAVSVGFLETAWAVSGADVAFREGAAGEPMPVVLHPVPPGAAERGVFAIFLSGDGGWAAFDAQVADQLAAQGVPVAGVSLLRWLWREKRPEAMARELAGLIARRSAAWGERPVLVIGFSMGANVAPFALRRLPAAAQARLAGLVLLAPERRTGFEISPAGWLGGATGAADVAAEIAALPPALPVLCVRGAEEESSACDPPLPGAATLALPGGHHLGKAHDRVAEAILELLGAAPGG
ncbi:AcvB/VirJ family lysyl-phosphatidylglycerol hydrolase [Albimonas pacifica]|uniref:Type IV secretory pathway, VirJ component n=1 Tax=Albimonas pacifica TaxID=1114924 RepID=A0A1I3BIC0_9RHOB|nr:AcvB/VirJ family lysyl-phosphatidylglycerol hydrolase [Albimonas pacifica]SFH62037.1 Type IV secretory pathway, VirJ component [Albimonas pacifica]